MLYNYDDSPSIIVVNNSLYDRFIMGKEINQLRYDEAAEGNCTLEN